MTQIIHKRGDAFSQAWLLDNVLPNGSSSDFETVGWGGRCQIRRDGVLMDEIPFRWLSNSPESVFEIVKNETQHWQLGNAKYDVEFTTPAGQKISSPTVDVIVIEDQTI